MLDLRLPDMDGVDVARTLADGRGPRRFRSSRSADAQQEDAAWLGDAGFAGYIQKPIDILDFPDQVRGYCSD